MPMRRVAALLLSSFCAAAPAQTPAATLRLHGSNTVGDRLAPALVEAWARTRDLDVTTSEVMAENERRLVLSGREPLQAEIRAHGTGTGFAALTNGDADIWMASRPANAAERAQSARWPLDTPESEHVIGLDGLAIIVHPDNRIAQLSVTQIRDVFSGHVRNWRALGGDDRPIRVHARDDQSGTFDTFRTLVLGSTPLRTDAQRYESSSALAGAVANDRTGIGFVGVAGVGRARPVAVSDTGTRPLLPDRLSVATEDYVLGRRLFFYTRGSDDALVRDFVEFSLGAQGQAIVEQLGFVSQRVAALPVTARQDAPDEYLLLTRGAQRLTINFRFGSGDTFLDSKALRDLDRLANWFSAPERRREQLMLFGFVDGNEINPYQAMALSSDRADYVAQQLVQRGLPPRRVRGMGGAVPVASNETEQGRGRNRRVEVWVGPASEVAVTAAAVPSS